MDLTDVAVKMTREREDMEVADTKKMKMCNNNGDLQISPAVGTVVRSHSEDASVATASELSTSKLENNTSTAALSEPAVSSNCDIDEALTSCCESSGSTNGTSKFVDLDDGVEIATEENNSEFEESRETIFSSELVIVELHQLESTSERRDVSCCRAMEEKMPSETELDEFFSVAEKHLLDRSAQKYNFDFMKEKPLEGCYEWVRL